MGGVLALSSRLAAWERPPGTARDILAALQAGDGAAADALGTAARARDARLRELQKRLEGADRGLLATSDFCDDDATVLLTIDDGGLRKRVLDALPHFLRVATQGALSRRQEALIVRECASIGIQVHGVCAQSWVSLHIFVDPGPCVSGLWPVFTGTPT